MDFPWYYIFMCYIMFFFFFCPTDLMEPIIFLASSWQKVEFERWPTLLDEVQDQYELNARKVGIVRKFCCYEQKYCYG